MLKKCAWENDTMPLPREDDPRNYFSTGTNILGGLLAAGLLGHNARLVSKGALLKRDLTRAAMPKAPKKSLWSFLPWVKSRNRKILEDIAKKQSDIHKLEAVGYGAGGLAGLAGLTQLKSLYNLATGKTRENAENRMLLRRIAENTGRGLGG